MRAWVPLALVVFAMASFPATALAGRRGGGFRDGSGCGCEKVSVPDVIGLSAADAAAELRCAGLVSSNPAAKGKITYQSLPCGTRVDRGHSIWIH